ncbi:MAG: hypothetical protein V4607_15435 [Pseudomonadota bacterium]
MMIYVFVLVVPTLLWAALGFEGFGKRIRVIAQMAFVSLILLAGSAYSIAQATAP